MISKRLPFAFEASLEQDQHKSERRISSHSPKMASKKQRSGSNHLEGLPLEIRREIFTYAITWRCVDFVEANHWSVKPFDRPIVFVYIRGSPRMSEGQESVRTGFWGTEEMTRLMRVNKRFHAEVHDLIYGSFAFFLSSSSNSEQDFRSWRDWLRSRNAAALDKIRYFVMPLLSSQLARRMMERKSRPEYQLRTLFPNMKGITINYFHNDSSAGPDLDDAAQVEALLCEVTLWKGLGVNAVICSHPSSCERGQEIVSKAQERNKQALKEATAFEQMITFSN
ncbi:uncharacterized protein PV09_08336 [Verruconis gallopava]|uniref:Uncharacterized protein n=1 Tax=Verruconis gallopava TaxID=253628 RepID=A0A0D1XD54_9PEZI|nr:uncharacterized protein PV09_08336 [Verruconis gallopava]KIW00161.1 hypothetical protein PV09_08336 [Verruconis gallopava]